MSCYVKNMISFLIRDSHAAFIVTKTLNERLPTWSMYGNLGGRILVSFD